MNRAGIAVARGLVLGMVLWLIWCPGEKAVEAAEPDEPTAQAIEPAPRLWTGGGGLGFLGDTPDGTALALNFHVDRFLTRQISLGPLLQLGFTDDMNLVGFSGQAKYWMDLPETQNRLKLILQGGVGFVHADFRRDDTSWLIPIGVGLDYAMSQKVSLTATFLLNFTDLDTGPGTGADVMPGLTVGVRF